MSLSKRAKNNFLWLFLSEVVSKGLAFVGSLYLARMLGKEGFGLFSLSLAVGTYLWIIADLGITGYGTREVAKTPELKSELYSILNSLRVVVSLVLFILLIGALYVLPMSAVNKSAYIAGGFFVIGSALSPDWVVRGLEKMQYFAFGSLTTSVTFIAGILLFVNDLNDTVNASIVYSVSLLIGSLMLMTITSIQLGLKFSFKITPQLWKKHIKESQFFAMNVGFSTFSIFMPFIFLGIFSSTEDIGLFSAPHRLITLMMRAGGIAISALYPVLSSSYFSDRVLFERMVERFQFTMLVILVPVCISVGLLGKNILSLLYGKTYASGYLILLLLTFFVCINLLRGSTNNALASAGFHRPCMVASGYGLVVTLGASFVLIPGLASTGAAISVLVGELVAFIFTTRIYSANISCRTIINTMSAKVVITGSLIVIADLSLRGFSSLAGCLVCICIYCAALYRFGLIQADTLISIKKTIRA